MSQSGTSRRLHGVLLADMTGFSRLMSQDESRAFAALTRIRDVFTTTVPRYGGTLDVLVGDCFVALFDSAVEAVQAAIAIQGELAGAPGPAGDPVRIRIGVHLGDVVRSGAEIHGDSVNVAARLQTIARPGAIALSEDVYRAVRNRITQPARDLGPKSLKGIRDKMRVYEIEPEATSGGSTADGSPARAFRPFALAGLAIALVAGAAVFGLRLATGPAILAVPPVATPPAAPAPPAPPTPVAAVPVAPPGARASGDGAPAPEQQLTVGVTGISAQGDVPSWMKDNTRDGLNTLLSKVHQLRVFSREKIDFLRERRGLSEIEVAETLGIQKMIVGALAMDGQRVVLEVRVVDIATGILDASESMRGSPDELIELQNHLAGALLTALHVPISDDERERLFAKRTNESLEGYRRLVDTFGEAPSGRGSEPPPPPRGKTSWLAWPRAAWAEDAGAEPAIRAVVEAYRAALQSKNLDAVAAVHVELGAEQRDGFTRYFASADNLTVSVSDIDVLLDGNEALVTFTRHDVFHDHSSGKAMDLEVRLSSVAIQQNGHWLLRGVKRSS